MKKKIVKIVGIVLFIIVVIIAVCNIYNWIVTGKQEIKINTSKKAYSNSDLYVSVIAQKNGVDLEAKTKLTLLDSKRKKVKNVNIKNEENVFILSIPSVDSGIYYIEANVSSKVGKDKVQKEIYINNENPENITITFDKGIYKPGDIVNYRALITSQRNDEPINEDINISIYDGNDNKVYNENVKSSDYGIISGNFKLASEVNSGIYKFIVKTKERETTKQFKVNPYVTPKYEVKVNYDKDSYLVGDIAKITFNAKYFFGEMVKNANLIVYVNDKEYTRLKTDSNGIATVGYKIEEAKTYNIKVETVDSSNYFVETTSNFIAGTDIFEIKLLPEYGTLAAGKKNDIYIFTNKADGTPLKTYATISSNNFTKQVATDENGIGHFSIDVNSISNSNSRYYRNDTSNSQMQFSVLAEDTEGNKVKKNIPLEIEQKDLLISTNKVKYNQGEDIKINISSLNENAKNIYFFKNNNLVKMLSTDMSDTTINLDDTYGLVDIYVTEKGKTNSNYFYNTTKNSEYKRTIFIKPSKQLSININTDKKEYKPGEKIQINFDTKNEDKSEVDAALLVSMLDNSILNLANNDMSIDNIKLALQNINFSNELDAATLYSCIINDSSEQTLMAMLLKQSGKDVSASETIITNYEQKEKSIVISVICIAIIVITIITVLMIKFELFRKGMKHFLNFIVYNYILITVFLCARYAFLWDIDDSMIPIGIITVIGLITYILFISKISKKVFRTSLTMILLYLIFSLLIFIDYSLEISPLIIGLIAVVGVLILVVFTKISEFKKLKIDKYMRNIKKEIIYIIKFLGALIISFFIGGILEKITGINGISIPLGIICLYFLNYKFNKIGKEEIDTINNSYEKTNKIAFYGIIVLALIGVMTLGYFIVNLLNHTINNYTLSIADDSNDRGIDPSSISREIDVKSIDGRANTNTSRKNDTGTSFFDAMGNLFSLDSSTLAKEKNPTNNVDEEENETEETIDDNVRNIFLESMCFIPELVTSNGTAKLELEMSDNITTWTIQTIGNTKDGRVGYGIKNDIKVFKEFFADFELPKNLVVSDNVSIPVTIYNYTDAKISTELKIKPEEWFKLENNNIKLNVDAKSSLMFYIPISVLKEGNNTFRVEVFSNNLTDIVEKVCQVSTKGYKVEKVVSTGNLSKDVSEDILFLEEPIEHTAKAKIKIYSSTMSQIIEGMENIFKMPTGCFEQISSSLYPNILALKYLEDNKIVNEEIRAKAISYISSGYQKLLTYEVKGESGGYSLYGYSPAETVLTAYGLMEVKDLSEVYDVDSNIIQKMTDFLYKKQNHNGTFTITGNYIGGAGTRETLALNAYITWALSECNPNDSRLNKSVEYLKGKLDSIDDNYTLALVANILANVEDKECDNVLKRLVNNTNLEGNNAYITSNVIDYYGSMSDVQTVQTVALTSMALSKRSYSLETNKSLINYLISKKDINGTWHSTQATILALKAINEKNEKNKLDNQTISVKVNSDEQKIEIKDNPLELYELTFNNLNKENKLNIDIEKGNAYYEVIEEYYIPYEKVNTQNDSIEISVERNSDLKVNEILKSNIRAINRSDNTISNGMITISIPQGFTVVEESLMLLKSRRIIEKYETSYKSLNIYLRNMNIGQFVDLSVWFRANYPVKITGMSIRAYDYYNPNIEGKTMPIEINVRK